jgi:uncharacterized protein (DUF433 family)
MAMTTKTLNEHIVATPGVLGGRPRIAGRRIGVEHIVTWHEEMGQSAEYIAREYELSLADVYAALAYYYDHKEEMDARARADEAFVEEMMRQYPSRLALNPELQRKYLLPAVDAAFFISKEQVPWWGRTVGSFRGQSDKVLY